MTLKKASHNQCKPRHSIDEFQLDDGQARHDPDKTPRAKSPVGGGHDPSDPPKPSCIIELPGEFVTAGSLPTCKLKKLIDYMNRCDSSDHPSCLEAERLTDELIQKIQMENLAE